MQTKPSHPAADLLPLMVGDEFDALTIDIRDHGLIDPIILHPDGSILDGRNRYRACQRLKIEPDFVEWKGRRGTEVEFVISVNVLRRHLEVGQRAMIADKIAVLKQGVKADAGIQASSQKQAAETMHVSRASVQEARVIRREAPKETVQAVERGEMSLHAATKTITRPNGGGSQAGRKTVTDKRAKLWRPAGEAIEVLGHMPDAMEFAQLLMGQKQAMLPKIKRAIKWLQTLEGGLSNGGNTDVS